MIKAKLNLKIIIEVILFILGALFLVLLVRSVGLKEIAKIIFEVKIIFLISGFLVYLFLILIRSFKWFLLAKIAEKNVRFKEFLPFYFVNCLIGNITPFKSGEAGTPLLLKKYLKIPVGQGFSVIVLDKFFEMLTFALIFLLAMIRMNNLGLTEGLVLFEWALLVLILLIFLLILVITSPKITFKILETFNPFKKYSLSRKILEFAKRELIFFYEGLSLFKNKRVYRFIVPLTLVAWSLELLSFYLIMRSVLPASFLDIATSQLIAITAALLTFIPVGLGVGEWGVVYALGLFGYSAALAASGVLLVRIFITGTLFSIGIIGTFLLRKKDG